MSPILELRCLIFGASFFSLRLVLQRLSFALTDRKTRLGAPSLAISYQTSVGPTAFESSRRERGGGRGGQWPTPTPPLSLCASFFSCAIHSLLPPVILYCRSEKRVSQREKGHRCAVGFVCWNNVLRRLLKSGTRDQGSTRKFRISSIHSEK